MDTCLSQCSPLIKKSLVLCLYPILLPYLLLPLLFCMPFVLCVCVCVFMYMCVSGCVCVYVCARVCVCVCVCVYSQRLCWWTSWSRWGRCTHPASRHSCPSGDSPPGWEWFPEGSSLPASAPDLPVSVQQSTEAQGRQSALNKKGSMSYVPQQYGCDLLVAWDHRSTEAYYAFLLCACVHFQICLCWFSVFVCVCVCVCGSVGMPSVGWNNVAHTAGLSVLMQAPSVSFESRAPALFVNAEDFRGGRI